MPITKLNCGSIQFLKRSVIKDNKGTMSRYEGIFEVNKGYFVFSWLCEYGVNLM